MPESPCRVFIGSGEASLLERKTLVHSLLQRASRPLEIYVFNGTHNTVERQGHPPALAPLPLQVKYRNVTEFSNYRFVIPEVCQHAGRAIYMDSDVICLRDPCELFDLDMRGGDILARSDAYGDDRWALSVMLIDCARARFDVARYYEEIDAGLYTAEDLHQMRPAFLRRHPFQLRKLADRWNDLDHAGPETGLIHFTNLTTQPWKFAGHRHEELWFEHLREALAAGRVTEGDIELSLIRAYVRQDLRDVVRGGRRRRLLAYAARLVARSMARLRPS
jgi:hypothetical protein